MLGAGTRVVPAVLRTVAREGSRELFTLGVLAIALGVAFASSAVFGVSLALGAFLAGVVVGESDVSHQAAAEALPLRDAFAVLFFVSIGMLFDPASWSRLVRGRPAQCDRLLRRPSWLSGSSPRSGPREWRDRRAPAGPDRRVLVHPGDRRREARPDAGRRHPVDRRDRPVSIVVNALAFRAVDPIVRWISASRRLSRAPAPGALVRCRRRPPMGLRGHAVICGYGRVGTDGCLGARAARVFIRGDR